MRAPFRFFYAAMIALSLALFTGATSAQAQPRPCINGGFTINNASTVPVTICLVAVPPIPCVTIPPGLAVSMPIPNPTTISGITSFAGINYLWQPNPLPPPGWWLPSIALPPAGSCFNVTYEPATCTMTVTLAGAPPCVNP